MWTKCKKCVEGRYSKASFFGVVHIYVSSTETHTCLYHINYSKLVLKSSDKIFKALLSINKTCKRETDNWLTVNSKDTDVVAKYLWKAHVDMHCTSHPMHIAELLPSSQPLICMYIQGTCTVVDACRVSLLI